jgi:Brp/Blh family beta-carotene 15,15'-monooxygenase
MIDSRNDRIYAPVVTITLAFGAAGWYSIDFLQKIQYPLLVVLVLLIGLPHGATDFLLFRRLHGPALRNSQVFRFFLFYVLSVLGYLLGWLFIPATALLVFLAISVYHFGQSNWQYAQLPRRVAFISNLAWGCFVLGGVLLWHWDESSIVISQLLGKIPDWSGSAMATWQWMILLLNIFLLIGLRFAGLINRNQFWRELGNFSVLSFMLFHTPMLVGFTLYFTLWHSLGSLLDQLTFFRLQWPSFSLLQYYSQAAPYTLLAIVGLLGLALGQSYLFSEISFVSLFFILISCMTLPHILLIEESYK